MRSMFKRLQRLLGGDPDIAVENASHEAPIATDASKVKAAIFDRSSNTVEVVGESHRQDALERIGDGRGPDGVNISEHVAGLASEPSNPVDPQAVEVQVNGWRVGYLSRQDARAYRPIIDRLTPQGLTMGCQATLVGGWDRGNGDAGSIGVKLHLGAPADLWAELDTMFGPEPLPPNLRPAPTPEPVAVVTAWDGAYEGKRVCFTGASSFSFQGGQVTRAMQELLAVQHGMTVLPRVTKKLDILVIGWDHPRTGKVKKAEDYGIPILDEVAFWSGLNVRFDA
jgi:hypothetical protein